MRYVRAILTAILTYVAPYCVSDDFALPPRDVLTYKQGLPQAYVASIVQDRQGFMWFATRDGLCRYDGERFKVFQPAMDGRPSLSFASVLSLQEDSQGRIWLATEQNDIDLFDPVRETFVNVSRQPFYRKHFSRYRHYCHYVDRAGNVWVYFLDKGLARVDLRAQRVRWYGWPPLSGGESSISADRVMNIIEDRQGNLWFGSEAGLRRLNPRTGQFSLRATPRELGIAVTYTDVQGIYQLPGGQLLLSGRQYIATFDPQTNRVRQFWKINNNYSGPYRANHATDSRGRHYVVLNGALYSYREGEGVRTLVATATHKQHLLSLYIDRSDVLWVGTNGRGVEKYDLRADAFATAPYRANFQTDLLTHYLNVAPKDVPAAYRAGSPYSFRYASTPDGALWLSCGADVYRLAGRTRRPEQVATAPKMLGENPPTLLATDPRGRVWRFSDTTAWQYDGRQWQRFPVAFGAVPHSLIMQMVVDNDALWLASYNTGLYRVDRRTGRIRQYLHHPTDSTSLSSNVLYCLHADPTNPDRLWIGTFGSGLNAFDKQTGRCRRLTRQQGLVNNVVYSAIPDRQGGLWVGTNQGLCRIDRQTLRVLRTYTSADGLMADEFNRFHYFERPDGTLIMGGLEGFTTFRPGAITTDTYQPNVVITNVQVNNQPVQPGGLPTQAATSITLNHNQSFITVAFRAMQYNRQGLAQYRYRLDGVNDAWVVTNRPEAIYTALAPGHYVLHLNAANTSGVWSPHVTTLTIQIEPPFWATWWAFSLYGLLALGLVYVGFRQYNNRLQLRQRAEWEHREAEQLRLLNEMKTDFFANITHEFRTPLTLILSPTEQLSRELHEPHQLRWLNGIRRNANQLLRLINQLMDLAKLEANALRVNEAQGNLAEFVDQLMQTFAPQADEKGIWLSTDVADVVGGYWFDADKLERTLYNLVANAIRFTEPGGRVSVTVRRQGEGVELTVVDTGIGIRAEKLPFIFNRFYQADDALARQLTGTGIGLALVKELTILQGGRIDVRSEVGRGTTFVLTLPYRPADTAPAVTPDLTQAPEQVMRFDDDAAARSDIEPAEPEETTTLLLVEDNPELAAFIAGCLPKHYRVSWAPDGQAGFEKAVDLVPDLIISDVLMPRMDGMTLCRKLKDDDRTSHIPVILLTAKSAQGSRLEGLQNRADDYVTKPFHPLELHLRIRNLITQRRRLRNHYREQLAQPAPTTLQHAEDGFLTQLHQHLDARLDDPHFGVEELADVVGMSRRTLHRKLTAVTGMGANELIRNYRLKRAADWLRSGRTVSETAFASGFDSAAYFSKCFKEFYGVSPSSYADAV